MAKNKVDEIFDIDAINAQFELLENKLKNFAKQLANLSKSTLDIRINGKEASNLNELTEAQNQYNKAASETKKILTEQEKIQKQNEELTRKLAAADSDLAKEQAKLKLALEEKNRANKQEAKANRGNQDSINSLRGELLLLQASYLDLSKADRDGAKGMKMHAEIQKVHKEVLEAEMSIGIFGRNVGNYSDSIIDAYNKLTKLKQQQTDLNNKLMKMKLEPNYDETVYQAVVMDLQDVEAQIQETTIYIEETGKKMLESGQDFEQVGKLMKQELKGIINQMAAMKISGEDMINPEKFAELSERAGELKDTIEGAKEEMNFFASDTKNIDGIINGIEGVVGAWGAVQGAMALVGGENKELEETFTKLQGIMTVIQSLQAVQNALQKESAFNMLASNIQRKIQVQLTLLEAKAEKGNIVQKWAAVAAQKALNLAQSLSPFGMLLVGIAALTAGYFAIRMALDNKTKAQKLDNEVSKQAAENSSDELIELKASVKQIQEAKAGRGDLTKAIANYNEKFGESGELTKEIVGNESKFNELIKQQTQLIINRAKAEAYLEKAKELAKQNIEVQQKGAKWYKELWNSAKNMGNVIGTYKDNQASANEEIAENNKLIEHSINQYVKLTDTMSDNGEAIESQKKLAEALEDVYNSILSTRISILKDGLNKELKEEKLSYQLRIEELQKKAKEDEKLRFFYQDLITYETEKHQQNLLKIYQEYADKRKDLILSNDKLALSLNQDSRKKEIDIAAKSFEEEKVELQRKIRDEIDFRAEYQKELELKTEAYNKSIVEINTKWDLIDLQNQANHYALKLESTQNYSEEQQDLLIKQNEILRDIEIKEAEKTGADISLIKKKYAKKEAEIRSQFIIDQAGIELQKRTNAENKILETELKAIDKQLKNKEIDIEEYNKKKLEIEKKYADLSLNNQILILEAEIAMMPEASEKKIELEQQLIDKKKELYEKDRENFIENEELKAEKEKEIREAAAESFSEIQNSLVEFTNQQFESKLMQLDEEQRIQDENLAKELERAGTNENYKAELQKRADAQTKKRAEERRKIELQQAKFEKANALFQAIIGTAKEVAKNAANPVLVALALATGAAQITAIAAQPIPKYAKGRKGGKSEIAMVGEAGTEAVIYPNKDYKIFDSPTVTYLPSGADVLTAKETANIFAKPNLQSYEINSKFANNIIDMLPLQTEIKALRNDIKNKEHVSINVNESGFNYILQRGNNITKFRNGLKYNG